MSQIIFTKYDPENGAKISERCLAHLDEVGVFELLGTCYEAVTRRNEPDGTITGEVFAGANDTRPAYTYKITIK